MQMNRVVQVKTGQDREDIGLQHRDQQFEADQRDVDRRREDREDADRAAKPPKIASIVWPASMLANSRIDRVNGRMK